MAERNLNSQLRRPEDVPAHSSPLRAKRPSPWAPAAILWTGITLAVLVVGFRQAIFIAPTEATMGNVQRIFYYHVPSAIVALIFPYINLAGSLAYLYLRRRNPLHALTADALALAAAEITVIYTSIGLATGMLWGRPVWGIWWTWDARLTTFLLLWLLYVSYLMLRRFSSSSPADGATSHTLAAVLSVFAAVDVPIVFMSIRWWRTQHPSPVLTGDGQLDPAMDTAFLWNLAGWFMWGLLILGFRFALERRRQLAEQDATLLSLESSLSEISGTTL